MHDEVDYPLALRFIQWKGLTLTSVIVDIGIVWVVSNSSFEITECTSWVAYLLAIALKGVRKLTKLHVYTGDLDPTLNERRQDIQTLFQISLGSFGITNQESIISIHLIGNRGGRYLKVALRLYASACPSLKLIP